MPRTPKYRSHEVGDVVAAIESMSPKEAKEAMKAIQKGNVPGMSRKQIKALEKPIKQLEKRLEGGVQLGATAAGIKDFFNSHKGNAGKAKPPPGRSSWW